jgi:trk system potassium uptake protein TrkH
MVVFLLCGGMSLYESLIHAFGTAGTGGFGIKGDSIASYSPYIQWVIGVFMLLFGINFNLFYLITVKKISSAIKSSELWCYFGIVGASTLLIFANVFNRFATVGLTIRHSFFQVSSIITTTGFSTTDFSQWPEFSKAILLILMFIGGCAGSTAGGLKVSRVMLLIKTVKRDLKKMLHPRSVGVVKHEGRTVEDATVVSTSVYLITYCMIFFVLFLIVSLEPFGIETAFSSVASCFNNIGPAFGAASSSFGDFSGLSKVVLSIAMLLGRLEIFPILLAFSPSTWLKR